MTRDDALKIARRACGSVAFDGPGPKIIATLEALGLLKFEESIPVADALAATIIYANHLRMANEGWVIGKCGAEQILKRLEEVGYKVERA